MSEYYLLIAKPPHRADFDAGRAAACFGRTASDLRVKAAVTIPEVWLGDIDQGSVLGKVEELKQCGLNVFMATGTQLLAVPPASQVEEFLINETDMTFDFADDAIELRFPRKLFVVSCRPKLPTGSINPYAFINSLNRSRQMGRMMGAVALGAAVGGNMAGFIVIHRFNQQRRINRKKAREGDLARKKPLPPDMAFLDVYYCWQGKVERMTIVEGTVNYSPLGSMKQGTSRANTKVLDDTIHTLYRDVHCDRRLENYFYKPATLSGLALERVLDSIHSALKEVDPFDLASRLIFLSAPPELLPTSPAAEAAADEASAAPAQPDAPAPLPSETKANRKTRLSFE
jgi:hypothetical protein